MLWETTMHNNMTSLWKMAAGMKAEKYHHYCDKRLSTLWNIGIFSGESSEEKLVVGRKFRLNTLVFMC